MLVYAESILEAVGPEDERGFAHARLVGGFGVDQFAFVVDIQFQAEFGDGKDAYFAGRLLAHPYLGGVGEILIAIFRSYHSASDFIAALGRTWCGKG